VGDVRRGKLVLEQALEVPLTPGDGESGGETQAAEVLANVVAKYGLAKCETLVAVGRSNVELKQLSIPPAPIEELADLVRLQAQFDFNSLGDDWPIDFLPLSAPAGAAGQRQVLAAAISPETVNQILDVCRRAELRPSHLVLRPCAAASLLCRRRAIGTEGVRLLVDVLRDEADLTVLTGQQALVLRTARLPSDVGPEAEEMRPLVGEIRRTIVAAQNLLGGEKVGQVELCGSGPGYAALAQWLAGELNLSVDVFDPLEGIELALRAPWLSTSSIASSGAVGKIGQRAPLLT
jgi:Tfp pilus assembly PilM family ATPase